METHTIKPGDYIVAKVDGVERPCQVLDIGEKIIIVIPLRTKRADPYEPPYCLLPSDIISITSND